MKHKQQDLEALLEVVDSICSDSENLWFNEKLAERFRPHVNSHVGLMAPEIALLLSDLRRTRGYLEKIDKTFYHEGFRFYQEIVDFSLKSELAKDYKLMKIAELDKDLVEYARRIVMQLENCFNYLIHNISAWEIIARDPNKFKYYNSKSGKYGTNLADGGRYSFFVNNLEEALDATQFIIEGKTLYKRKLRDIGFPTKKEFFSFHYGCYFDFHTFKDLNFLRNKASHRGKSDEDVATIEALKRDWYKNSYEYFFMLQQNLSKMKDLFN